MKRLAQAGSMLCGFAAACFLSTACGETHSIRELCEIAFGHAGLDWTDYVVQDDRFYRPAEVDLLIGDPARARDALGWAPRTSFAALVEMMVDADVAALKGFSAA